MSKALANLQTRLRHLFSGSMLVLILLLVLVEVSAMGVVYSTYRSRAQFAELEKLRDGAEDMQVTWSQLLLEQSTLASYSRVSEVAQSQLDMKVPEATSIVMLQQP